MKSEDWNRRYAGTERLWSAGPNRFVEEELSELPPGRAIDLAAGEGRNAIWLAEQGWRVTAVDFANVAIDRGRAAAAERGVEVDWQVEDLASYVPAPDSYDLVLIAYLQLPWDEMALVLRRAAAAVRPGGRFFLVGHDRRNLREGYGGPKSEAVLHSPADIAGELEGLTVEVAETVERPVDTPEGPRVALDALVCARR